MAVHIIFRSGGLIISMFLGWLIAKKRYNVTQIFSVILVTIGVVFTTLSASPQRSPRSPEQYASPSAYMTGISILTLALIFSGFLGLVQDWTYSKHGRPAPPTSPSNPSNLKPKEWESPAWQESMFYLHFLGLPMFFSVRSDLVAQISTVNAGPRIPIPIPIPLPVSLKGHVGFAIPAAYIPLLLNTLTQLLCVAGVHRLTTRVSALAVTLVLVVRKAVSLVISVIGVGIVGTQKGVSSEVDQVMMWSGAAMVLAGTIAYSIGSRGKMDPKKKSE
ncbi:hypothetical protein H0H87_008233 [Tephrocybe sp. NHM501043]|nr:hypothetical protein H0H87_008233 [Tephrocybe sp. NHM501043]